MCVVSMVSDYGRTSMPQEWWRDVIPGLSPIIPNISPPYIPLPDPDILKEWQKQVEGIKINLPPVVKEPEMDKETVLKEFFKLLKQAALFDESSNQKDCEDPEKTAFLKKLLDKLETIDQELLTLKEEIKGLLKLDEKNI